MATYETVKYKGKIYRIGDRDFPEIDGSCAQNKDGWNCSRRRGHRGLHVAVGFTICLIWKRA